MANMYITLRDMQSFLGHQVASTDDAIRRRSESEKGYLPEDENALKALNFLQLEHGQWVLNRNLNLSKTDIMDFLNWYGGPKEPPFPPIVRTILCLNRAKLKNAISNIGNATHLRTGAQENLAKIEDLLKKGNGEKNIPENTDQCKAMKGRNFVSPGIPGEQIKPAPLCPTCPPPSAPPAEPGQTPWEPPTPMGVTVPGAVSQVTLNCDTGALGVALGEIKGMLEIMMASSADGKFGPLAGSVGQLQNAVGNLNVPDIAKLLDDIKTHYAGNQPVINAIAAVSQQVDNKTLLIGLQNLRTQLQPDDNATILAQLDELIKSLEAKQAIETTQKNVDNLPKTGLSNEEYEALLKTALTPLMGLIEAYGAELKGIHTNIQGIRTNIGAVKTSLIEQEQSLTNQRGNIAGVRAAINLQSDQLTDIRTALAELRAFQEFNNAALRMLIVRHMATISFQINTYKELILQNQRENTEHIVATIVSLIKELSERVRSKNKGNGGDGGNDGNGGDGDNDDNGGDGGNGGRELADRIAELGDEVTRLLQDLETKQGDIRSKNDQIARLETELATLKSPQSPNKARITELESAAQRNSARRADIEEQIERLRSEITAIRESSETERTRAAATIAQLENEKSSLDQLLKNCNDEKTALESTITAKTEEIQGLRARISELEAIPPQNDVQLEDLRSSLERKSQELGLLGDQLTSIKTTLGGVQQQLADCERSLQDVKSALTTCQQNSDSKNARYRSELEDARKRAQANMDGRQTEYLKQIKQLESKHSANIDELSRDFDINLDEALAEERQKCKEIQANHLRVLSEKDTHIATLEAKLKDRPQNCDELQARISELEAQLAQKELPQNCDELQARISELEAQLAQKDETLEELSQELSQCKATMSALKLTIAEKDTRISELETRPASNAQIPVQPTNPQSVSRLVELPAFLSNFKDINIKIKPDLAIGLGRLFRPQKMKNARATGKNSYIDNDIRKAVFEILNIMGPSSTHINHDELQKKLTQILEHPQFKHFAETEAAGFNITTPMHIEEVSYKLLEYIVNEGRKTLGGTRSQRKISQHYTRKRR